MYILAFAGVLQAVRALRNALAALAVFFAGVAPVHCTTLWRGPPRLTGPVQKPMFARYFDNNHDNE